VKERLPNSTHEGKLNLGDIELSVAVLEDGTRIITQSGVFKAFGRTKRGRAKHDLRVLNMPAFVDAKNLQPLVNERLMAVLNQVDYLDKNGKQSTGYDAKVLPMLCKLYLDAREFGVLVKQQMPLGDIGQLLLNHCRASFPKLHGHCDPLISFQSFPQIQIV
jgi:hypothetical protein